MTLPAAPSSISMSQVNSELGLPIRQPIKLSQANVQTLADGDFDDIGFVGPTIRMSDLRGKSVYIPPIVDLSLIFNDPADFKIGGFFNDPPPGTQAYFNLERIGAINKSILTSEDSGPTQYLSEYNGDEDIRYEARLTYLLIGFGSAVLLGQDVGEGLLADNHDGTSIGHEDLGPIASLAIGGSNINRYRTPYVTIDRTISTSLVATEGAFIQFVFNLEIRRIGTQYSISRNGSIFV